jgi:UDP-N-acetylmuramate--alanine ligase
VDCYPTLQDLRDTFLQFANRVPFYGACVVCGDDPNVRAILPRMTRRALTYGFSQDNALRAVELESGAGERFEVWDGEELRGEVSLLLLGRHNVLNALAAIAAAREMGVEFDVARRALASFPGAERRFQIRGEARGIRVVDDYGHHPTEVAATLEAARRFARGGRVVALFQPHRYTRLNAFMEDFAKVLSGAEVAVVTEVYPAAEEPIPGVDGASLVERLRQMAHPHAHFCASVEDLPVFAAPLLQEGDVVLTMGAGSITHVGERLLALLREGHGP